jgi:hypothetical protein
VIAVVKKHGKKSRARQRAQRTGAAHQSAATRTTHTHVPLPDMAVLTGLPYGAGGKVNIELAARLVAACRAGCRPCQTSLARKVRADRPTLAVLAGAVFGLSLNASVRHSPVVSPTTRAWSPLALSAHESGDGTGAFAAVQEMTDADASELLEDALDHWAAGGAESDMIQILDVKPQGDATSPSAADPYDITHAFQVVDLGLPDDPDGVPAYSVLLARTFTPDGQPFPMLTLECESAGAGIADLRRRTDWSSWDGRRMPQLDFNWRLRVDIASRSLHCLVHIDREGNDELPHLWDASETVPLPENWWNLLDRAQHVLVAGPVKDAADETALTRAAGCGELLAVVARVSFG